MNVLITGANGFIGSNLVKLLSDISYIKLFPVTRTTVNLYSQKETKNYIKDNNINTVLHTAIEGGKRGVVDSPEIVYNNLLMFENLMSSISYTNLFINFASGAEFDRRKGIDNCMEECVGYCVPVDYYGFSKNLISKRIRQIADCGKYTHTSVPRLYNLRLFGCFYHNESDDRFIKSNMMRYIKKEPMIIHRDKFMDFFYMEDLVSVILTLFREYPRDPYRYSNDINIVYNNKVKLSGIAQFINNLDGWEVPILLENEIEEKRYTGNAGSLSYLNIKLKGLEEGIKECYEKLKHLY